MTANPGTLDDRLRDGDRAALESWFAEHRQELKGFVARRLDERVRRRVDASDVVQQVYLEADARLEHFAAHRDAAPFDTWIRQVARQTLVDVHRRHVVARSRSVAAETDVQRTRADDSSPHDGMAALPGNLTSPSGNVMRDERKRLLLEALDRLPETDREVLVLRHFENLGNAEVAERLGLAPTAASNRYVRALRRLVETLQKPGAEPGFL